MWRLIFIKEARCFEAKKAINHELEVHGYGGGEEEDEEEMMMVTLAWKWGKQEEDKKILIFVGDIL